MSARHASKAIARAASVVVESLERRQMLAFSTLEVFAPSDSGTASATALPDVRVDTPDPMARATVAGGVRLAWPAVNGARNGYEIHRRTGDGAYEMVATVRGNAALGRLGGRVSYLDLNLQPGQAYTYRIRGVGPASTRGEWSKTVSVLIDKKALEPGAGRTAAMIAASARLAAYATSGSTVQLSWSKLPAGAKGYEIQRRFGDDGYATIATLASIEAVADVNGQIGFEDAGLLEGEGYSYRVRPLGLSGDAAAWSNEYSVLIPQVSRTADSFVLPSQGTTVTLNTTADTHARSGTYANHTYGSDVWNGAKLGTGDEHREAFYKFDLTSLSGSVTGVKVRFNGRLSASDGTKTFQVKAVSNTSWSESSVSYNSRPSTGATLGSFNVSSTSDGWYEVDVTSYINAELAANRTTVSFAVVGAATSTAFFRINSKESGSNSAQLSVTLDASTTLRTPTDDTHGRSGTGATSIFGNDVWNGAKLGTGDEHREAFYKFDLSGVEGTLEQAVIRFYGHLNTSDGTRTFNVQSVSNTSWVETSLTYNNRPTTGRTTLGSFNVSSTSDGWYQVDVTDYIESQLAGSQTIASFAVAGSATSTAYFWINSKESGLNAAQLVMTIADDEPPTAPTSSQATQTSAPVTVSWADASSNETGFVVQRSTSSTFTSPTEFSAAANATSYADWSIAGSTTYYYRVKAVNGSASSAWTSTVSITTASTSTADSAPTADTYVRDGSYAGTNYGTSNDLSVKTGPTDYTRYAYLKFDLSSFTAPVLSAKLRLYGQRSNTVDSSLQFAVREVSDTSWTETGLNYSNRPSLGSTLATFDIQNTMSSVWYEIDLTPHIVSKLANNQSTLTLAIAGVATSDAQWTFKSRETADTPALRIVTANIVVPPSPPSNLQTTSVAPNGGTAATIALSWADNAGNESGFKIERREAGQPDTAWAQIGTTGTNVTTYNDSTALTDKTYDYRVRATNTAGDSSYATLTGVQTPPAAPSGLTITNSTATSISLSWTDNATSESEYRVERRLTGGSTYSTIASGLAANTTAYTDNTAAEGTQYDYRVRPVRGSSLDGSAAGPVQAWTKLATPTAVTATPAAASAVTVTWTDNTTLESGYEIDVSSNSTFPVGGTVTRAADTVVGTGASASKLIDNLSAGTTYYFRVRAVNANTASANSGSASTATLGQLSIARNPTSGNVNEGSPIVLTAQYASGVVPGTMTYTWTINDVPQTPSSSNTYELTPADQGTVTASVVAKNGLAEDSATLSPSITVVNVAPTLTAVGDATVAANAQYVLQLLATDPGSADTITWNINWGDGSAVEQPTGRDLEVPHEYATSGNYTITVTAGDGTATNVAADPATINVVVLAGPPVISDVETIDENTVIVRWQDNRADESGWEVRFVDTATSDVLLTTAPAHQGSGELDVTYGELSPGTTYAISVRSKKSGADSDWSAAVAVTTPIVPTGGAMAIADFSGMRWMPWVGLFHKDDVFSGADAEWSTYPIASNEDVEFGDESLTYALTQMPRHTYLGVAVAIEGFGGEGDPEIEVSLDGVSLPVTASLYDGYGSWSTTGTEFYSPGEHYESIINRELVPHEGTTANIEIAGSGFSSEGSWRIRGVYVFAYLPTAAISATPLSVNEGGTEAQRTITYVVSRSMNWLADDLPVELAWSGTADSDDVEGNLPTEIVIPSGQFSTTFDVIVKNDSLFEGSQELVASIVNGKAKPYTSWEYTVGNTIVNDDAPDFDTDSDNDETHGVAAHSQEEDDIEAGSPGKKIATSDGLPTERRRFVPLKLDIHSQVDNSEHVKFSFTEGLRLWTVPSGAGLNESWLENSGHAVKSGTYYQLSQFVDRTVYVEATGRAGDYNTVTVIGGNAPAVDVIAFTTIYPNCPTCGTGGTQQRGNLRTEEVDVSGKLVSPTRSGDGSGTGFDFAEDAELILCGNAVAIQEGELVRIYDWDDLTPRIPGQGTLKQEAGGFTETLPDGRTLHFETVPSGAGGAGGGSSTRLSQMKGPGGEASQGRVYLDDGRIDYEWATLGSYTERAEYSYDASDRVSQITIKTGEGTILRYAAYDYYAAGSSAGPEGALSKVQVYDYVAGGADQLLDVKHYRYYTSTAGDGIAGKVKYFFGADGYARMLAAGLSDTSSDELVQPYADDYFKYDVVTGQVKAVASSGSGCSSCSGGVGTTQYSYAERTAAPGYNSWKYKRTETLDDGTHRTIYTNFALQPMLEVVETGGKTWRTYYRYDADGKLVLKANPSAVNNHYEVYADLVSDFEATTTLVNLGHVNDEQGVVEIREYYGPTENGPGQAPGQLKATWLRQGDGGGNYTTGRVAQTLYTYTSTTANGVPTYFIDTSTVYKNTDGTGALVTDYDYTFYSGTAQMQTRTVKRPIVLSTQNGPGTQVSEIEYYDLEGRLLWSRDGEGYITGYLYNDDGSLDKSIVDVDTNSVSNEPSGWVTPSGGGLHLITDYTTDDLGRTVKTVDPKGNITYTVYKDADHEVRTYRANASGTILGPVSVSREDRAHNYTESLTYTFSGTYAFSNGLPTGAESLTGSGITIHSLSRATYNAGGQMVESIAFHNLTGVTYSQATARLGTEGTNYTVTHYAYDKQGRQNRVENANGTITRTIYDGVGQVQSTWVGTDDQPDEGHWSPTNNAGANMVKVSESIYDHGTAGDGNLTRSINYVTNSTTGARVTDYAYDWRNRLVATKSGVESSESTSAQRQIVYSDLNNLGQQLATYVYDGDGESINSPNASKLRAKTINEYDNQGRVFRTTTYSVDPDAGTVSSTGISSESWFDKRGQVIKSASTASPTQKTVYDGAGRVTKTYITDGGGDTSYADADDVTGDTVLEQAEYTYDANSNVILTTSRQRFHNASGTGELGSPSSGIGARVSYAASYYDALDRVTDSVNVGTNGGSAWTRPGTVPSRSDNVLVTSYTYNDAGRLTDVTDPKNIVTRTEYDALGRTTRTIEAFTNGVPTDSTNRITAYTYDGIGNVTHLKAVLPDGPDAGTDYDVQDTQYVYGATTARGDGINSNDVLIAVRYPDKSTGLASVGEEEKFETNALGQTTEKTDRNGNVHTFTYDVLGRLTSDTVTTLGTGVDGAIRRIDTTYNTQGLPETITSYSNVDGLSTQIVNQVQRKYNGLGQLTHEFQAHDGAVNESTTPSVQYGYSAIDDGSRLTQLTYPNGRTLTYSYGASNSLNDTISRLDAIIDGLHTLEAYAYLGLSGVVKRMHPQSGIDLTYVGTPGDAGDQYAGLDRLGRVVDHKWQTTSNIVDQFTYTYDRNSNRLTKSNPWQPAHSESYTYDNLNRLATTNRNGSAHQSWNLDALGNSNSVTTGGVTENRTHNSQNQLTQMGSNALAFDKNGNTTTDQHGRTLVYDAWNRLVEAKNGSTSLIRYEYDGLTRRIEEGTVDQFFSAAWQVLEERNASNQTTASYAWSPVYVDAMIARDRNTDLSDADLEERLYVLQDANFNIMTIADTSGSIVERYLYDPYGQRTILDANYATDTDSTSDFAFQQGHQGGKYDGVLSNQMLFRHRVYDVETMRWSRPDPLRYVDGLNTYSSWLSSPLRYLDPSGLKIDNHEHVLAQRLIDRLERLIEAKQVSPCAAFAYTVGKLWDWATKDYSGSEESDLFATHDFLESALRYLTSSDTIDRLNGAIPEIFKAYRIQRKIAPNYKNPSWTDHNGKDGFNQGRKGGYIQDSNDTDTAGRHDHLLANAYVQYRSLAVPHLIRTLFVDRSDSSSTDEKVNQLGADFGGKFRRLNHSGKELNQWIFKHLCDESECQTRERGPLDDSSISRAVLEVLSHKQPAD